jgi:hypothetical protein
MSAEEVVFSYVMLLLTGVMDGFVLGKEILEMETHDDKDIFKRITDVKYTRLSIELFVDLRRKYGRNYGRNYGKRPFYQDRPSLNSRGELHTTVQMHSPLTT